MGRTSNVKWKGEQTYILDGREFEVEFIAYGTYYYDAGCMYLKNGDPGYPPEEECEVSEVEFESIIEYEPNTEKDGINVTESLDAETCEKLEGLICDDCYDGNFEMENLGEDYPEPDEE